MKTPGYLHLAVWICRLLPPQALARFKRLICEAFIGRGYRKALPHRTIHHDAAGLFTPCIPTRGNFFFGFIDSTGQISIFVVFSLNQIDAFNLIKHVETPDITRIIELVQFLYKTGILRCIEKNAFKC
jgi:hypothetical protein